MVATIQDIARLASTSKSTVSRYLNGGSVSRQRAAAIEKVILQLGYQPNLNARRLVSSSTKAIGVVFDDISDYIYGEMIAGINNAAASQGYSCVFLSRARGEKESSYLHLFAASVVDGMICVTFRAREPEDVRRLQASGKPLVLVGDTADMTGVARVDVDNQTGTRMQVDSLIQQGHRRIAYLQGPDTMPAAGSRLRGYLKALESAGLPREEGLIRKIAWTAQGAYQVTGELVRQETFTALCVSNAYAAYGALLALQDAGLKVPEQVALAGFDEAPICELARPAITTLRQPNGRIGQIAAELLIGQIREGRGDLTSTYVLPSVILRASTQWQGGR
ncbi:MAG: LacI family DNA-binding transcriptional regulator [Christensenellales bacterium]